MHLLLISFFISLLAIIFMIGRKLVLLKNGNIATMEQSDIEFINLKELRHNTFKNIKKYEHIVLVAVVRFYIKLINLLKNIYHIVKTTIRSFRKRKQGNEEKEVSKFLKVVSEYKQKIREIKHQIHEEDKL